jgi:hypothetical protein
VRVTVRPVDVAAAVVMVVVVRPMRATHEASVICCFIG